MVWEGRIRSSEKMMFGGAGERSILFVLFLSFYFHFVNDVPGLAVSL